MAQRDDLGRLIAARAHLSVRTDVRTSRGRQLVPPPRHQAYTAPGARGPHGRRVLRRMRPAGPRLRGPRSAMWRCRSTGRNGCSFRAPARPLALTDVARLHRMRCDASIAASTSTCDPVARDATIRRLADERERAPRSAPRADSPWGSRSRHLDPEAPRGDPLLIADLDAYLERRGLAELDRHVARGYVSNPSSGDLVKAHAVVAAELGLAPYHGPILRDPAALRGELASDRRAAHLLARLGLCVDRLPDGRARPRRRLSRHVVRTRRGLETDGDVRVDDVLARYRHLAVDARSEPTCQRAHEPATPRRAPVHDPP